MKTRLLKLYAGFRSFLKSMPSSKLALLGYASYVLLGWALLCHPLAQKSGASSLDNLFTAVSAVSTTGLTTTSLERDYSFFGQLIVLALIQLGGIGYMTLSSFIVLATRKELPPTRDGVCRTVFALPSSFDTAHFVKCAVAFTFVVESIGALALYFIFLDAGKPDTAWSAIFHSVSAFCTAGFSLYDDSMSAFAGDFWALATISALSYLGAVGFIVWVDIWNMLTRRVGTVTLTSKIILWATFWLSCAGTLLIFFGDPSIQAKPPHERLLAAFFQAMSAMSTVGFNSIDIGALSNATLLVLIVLMIIGASPAGTGGGLKCTTFTALLGMMNCARKGEQEVRFWKRIVPQERLITAAAAFGFYLAALVVGTYLLELTEKNSFVQNLFEATSALGTVGLSMGITPQLSVLGKVVIILLMFCGRMGPLTFGMALLGGADEEDGKDAAPEDIAT